jgi:diguanylate cyclase (GGDEF)-like protein
MRTRKLLFPFQALIGVAGGLIGLAVLAIGLTVWGLYADAIEDAERHTDNIAIVLADQTLRSMQSLDIVLDEVKARAGAVAVITPADFRERLGTERVHDFITERLARLPQAEIVTIADHEGRIVNSTRQWPPRDIDLAEREDFQYLSTHDTPDLYVVAPVIGRTNGAWTLFFSKRINGAGGDFVGIVTVGVETRYFQHVYTSVGSLAGQSFLLLRRDGTVLVRYPDIAGRSGQKLPASSPWHRFAASGGAYRTEGVFDREARLVTVRPVRGYPLVVDVTMLESAALAKWQRRATLIGLGTLLALLCAGFMLRALIRLTESEASIAEREARLADKSQELEAVNLRLDAALNNMSQGLCMFDKDEKLVVCNERYTRMYGLPDNIARSGCTVRDLIERRAAAGTFSGDAEQYLARLREQIAQGRRSYITNELGDGRTIAVLNQPMIDGGWVATHEDITERQRSEARIAHMARHDALTDLANRVLFRERMDDVLARLDETGEGFAVFIFDLDLFKSVNDSLGHPIGDALLKAVALRLQTCTDASHTVGRLGGDEFAIIQTEAGDQKAAAIALADTLLETVGAPYEIDGHQIVIGISIGIALAPADGEDASELLKNADLALYRAKQEGRNGYRFFALEMDTEVRLQRALEVDLRNALVREEFEIHYQLIFDIASHQPCGAEALLRWRHPQHGMVFPDTFIPVAEEIGLIGALGEWVLRQACANATRWPAHIRLAVNLSPVQFRGGNLVELVADALKTSGLAPERLELEITESVLLQKDAGTLAILYQLTELGVRIVLDDFGTGYSSLSYLRMFPFKKIKIDKSFVAELSHRADCAAIVCAVTNLAQSLDMTTTAEGVETWEQFELLHAAGCREAQGYLFSRPCPAWKLDFEWDETRETQGRVA